MNVNKLAKILNKTDVRASFLGATKVLHYNKKVSIDFIATKTMSLINEFIKDWKFSEKQRKSIAIISEKNK